jgi:hypothetical protein
MNATPSVLTAWKGPLLWIRMSTGAVVGLLLISMFLWLSDITSARGACSRSHWWCRIPLSAQFGIAPLDGLSTSPSDLPHRAVVRHCGGPGRYLVELGI